MGNSGFLFGVNEGLNIFVIVVKPILVLFALIADYGSCSFIDGISYVSPFSID